MATAPRSRARVAALLIAAVFLPTVIADLHLSFAHSLPEDKERADAVRSAMKHAWDSYKTYAWGKDELDPINKNGVSSFGNTGVTIIDSLSTLKIMGLESEFEEGAAWIRDNLDFGRVGYVSLFETNIRHLGGLLSAHALSGDEKLKELAIDLGTRMLPAFTRETGFPYNNVDLSSGSVRRSSTVSLAEVGTLQLEFLFLSYVSGDPKFAEPVMKILRTLDHQKTSINNGLGSQSVSIKGEYQHDRWTLGAMADSYYEYLLKLWYFTGKNDDYGFRRMWETAADLIRQFSVKTVDSDPEMIYVGEIHRGVTNNVMDHLACFTGGMFAMAHDFQEGPRNAQIGAGITKTCSESYFQTESGVAPEVFSVASNGRVSARVAHNILRPETVESVMILYRLTGDPKYREWGWRIFQAFEKQCRVPGGYAGLRNVNQVPVQHDNRLQSFFMAETLKYLYLLFASSSVIPLDDFIFNTEAHPLPIPKPSFWKDSGIECMFPEGRAGGSCSKGEASRVSGEPAAYRLSSGDASYRVVRDGSAENLLPRRESRRREREREHISSISNFASSIDRHMERATQLLQDGDRRAKRRKRALLSGSSGEGFERHKNDRHYRDDENTLRRI